MSYFRCGRAPPLPALLAAAVLSTGPFNTVRAEIIADMPDAIVCSVKDPTGLLPWERLVFYVSASTVDGRTLYKTLTSDPVVLLVSAEGVVSGGNLADCDGRTLDSLAAEGKAFVLTGSTPVKGGTANRP